MDKENFLIFKVLYLNALALSIICHTLHVVFVHHKDMKYLRYHLHIYYQCLSCPVNVTTRFFASTTLFVKIWLIVPTFIFSGTEKAWRRKGRKQQKQESKESIEREESQSSALKSDYLG